MNARAKDAALASFDEEWRTLDALFRSLSASDLERPVYTEDGRGWRIRDLIPHIATWQDRAARAARKVLTEGIQPKPDDRVRTFIGLTDTVEDMNDVTFNAWRARPTADLLSEFQTKHAEMMTALAGLTPGQFMGGDSIEEVFMAFRIPGWQHVRIHRDHVEAALTKEGSTR